MNDEPENNPGMSGRGARIRDLIRGLAGAALAAVAACTLIAFGARLWWRFELACHWRAQYAVASLVLGLVLYACGGRRLAVAAGSLAVLNAAFVVPVYFGNDAARTGGPRIRVLSANVQTSNHQHARLLSLVRQVDPDVVLLMEVDEGWGRALEPLAATHEHHLVVPRSDNFGIALYSRLPMADGQVLKDAPDGVPTIAATFVKGTRSLTIIGTHPVPPMTADAASARDRQLSRLAEWNRAWPKPLIVVGDLNVTPYAPAFRDFTRITGLRDSRRGFGVQATWPVSMPVLRIPIDHCLVSPEVTVVGREVGPDIGSDHFPIVVDVSPVGSQVPSGDRACSHSIGDQHPAGSAAQQPGYWHGIGGGLQGDHVGGAEGLGELLEQLGRGGDALPLDGTVGQMAGHLRPDLVDIEANVAYHRV